MKDELLALLTAVGQEHLVAFWDELDEARRSRLAGQIHDIDFDLMARLYRGQEAEPDWAALAAKAEPPPAFRLEGCCEELRLEGARRRGEATLAGGKLAVILVAGGQGTRLGFDHPKGMLPLGPVSGHSIFQLQIEKLIAVANRYGSRIPLYLMTSPATHEETIAYLVEHDRFGLPPDDLHVFCQAAMPAVDAKTGKVLLAGREAVSLSPDGHGGMVAALIGSGSLDDLKRRGIEQLFYMQVDNPLTRVCDPVFVGYHLLSGSEMSTQVVAKTDPLEKVGNVVAIDGKLHIIEYSDLPGDAAQRRGEDGSLHLWAGNIAVHLFDIAFLDRVVAGEAALPFHRATKTVSYVDTSGQVVDPETLNAIKFERFIFDLLPSARHAIVQEVDKSQTFAPVKNANGAARDTPATSQGAMVRLHSQWLRSAGARIEDGIAVEISPLFALDSQELIGKIEPGTRLEEATYLR